MARKETEDGFCYLCWPVQRASSLAVIRGVIALDLLSWSYNHLGASHDGVISLKRVVEIVQLSGSAMVGSF